MRKVNYDSVADAYDRRYQRHDYRDMERAVFAFVADSADGTVLEVGCGTGHWLSLLATRVTHLSGLDPSRPMLEHARLAAPSTPVVQGRAEWLPYREASVDRIYCVNALHHFSDPAAFFAEARRVLRPGGALLSIGLDPHTGRDQWWIYEYFPEAQVADRQRYLAAARIAELMTAAGFIACETKVVQHIPAQRPLHVAIEQGLLDRRSTSQLMVISDAAYEAGIARLHAAVPAPGEPEPILRADLRLHGTMGRVSPEAT